MASAQQRAYDPLVLSFHGFLAADGALVEDAPAPAVVPFPPSTPAAPGAPLRFTLPAPVRFAAAGGVEVALTVSANAPVLTGDGVELAIEGGTPQRVALRPALAPGETQEVHATLPAPSAAFAKGDDVTLSVRALAPALPERTLFLVIGPSTLDVADMRVPGVADLELQDAPLAQFLLGAEAFGGVAQEIVVTHAGITARPAPAGNVTHVALRGEEEDPDAREHAFPDRERRIAAAHVFTVNGIVARVHPGIGVVVPALTFPIQVRCTANCPPGGFALTLGAPGATPSTERPSSLIPPPRDTSGIPVSEDEPEKKGAPMPALVVLAALALAGLRRR